MLVSLLALLRRGICGRVGPCSVISETSTPNPHRSMVHPVFFFRARVFGLALGFPSGPLNPCSPPPFLPRCRTLRGRTAWRAHLTHGLFAPSYALFGCFQQRRSDPSCSRWCPFQGVSSVDVAFRTTSPDLLRCFSEMGAAVLAPRRLILKLPALCWFSPCAFHCAFDRLRPFAGSPASPASAAASRLLRQEPSSSALRLSAVLGDSHLWFPKIGSV